jgi:hypothetical protein
MTMLDHTQYIEDKIEVECEVDDLLYDLEENECIQEFITKGRAHFAHLPQKRSPQFSEPKLRDMPFKTFEAIYSYYQ